MKTRSLFAVALLAAGVALGISGCAQQPVLGSAHVPAARPAKTFALAVTLPDGSQPTPAQWAAVKTAFEQQLAAAGATLTDNISLADKIIRVVFTPAEDDPSNGNAMVLSVRDNPAYAFNTRAGLMPVAYTSSLGFGYSSGFPGAYNSYNSYYGYNDYYDYSSSGGTIVTPRVEPPNHHRPTQPVDCPPGQERPGHSDDRFAGGPNGSWNRDGHEHGGTWTRSGDGSTRTWTRVDADGTTHTWTRSDNNSGGRTWTRAEPYPTNGGNSSGGRTWTRSEPGYATNNSSSGSGSSASYSNNSSSSSYSSSSSSNSSSYAGGSSSSASDFSSSSSSSPGSFSSGSSSNSDGRDYSASRAER